jgi:uncharacterized membrane protein (UPF0127 family)
MRSKRACVFNQSRQSFLSLNTIVADSALNRLRGMIGRRGSHSDFSVWVVPSKGIHTFGVFHPIDVVYLDAETRVLLQIEDVRPFRITPFVQEADSVLQLPRRTLAQSQTQPGDSLSIWSARDLEGRFVAVYGNGGYPEPHPTRQVSCDGAFIQTRDRWYPGTIIDMALHRRGSPAEMALRNGSGSQRVRARVIHGNTEGVEVEFLFVDSTDKRRLRRFLAAP